MKSKGFTLIELLVVVAIIGVLASVVLGALNDARAKARDARRQSDIKTIQNQLELYYIDNGEYPDPTGGWILTHTWGALETALGVDLPKDPLDTGGYPYQGGYTYGYHGGATGASAHNMGCPPGQAYYLTYNQERTIDPSENVGVTRCNNGLQQNFGNNSITVGFSPAQ